MPRRLLTLLALAACLAASRPLAAEGSGSTSSFGKATADKPAARAGGRTTLEKAEDIVAALKARETALLTEQPELLKWRDDQAASASRARQLERRVGEVKARDAAAIDPELVPQLELLLELVRDQADDLATLSETYRQEQQEVRRGLEDGKRLIETLQAAAPRVKPAEHRTLDELVAFEADLHRERISIALLRARRAGLNEEANQKLKDSEEPKALGELPAWDGDAESRAETLKLREEYARRLAERVATRTVLRAHVTALVTTQLQRLRIEIAARMEERAVLRGQRSRLYGALQIGEADVTGAEKRRDEALDDIEKREREVQRDLKALRLKRPADGTDDSSFGAAREWQLSIERLQYRLYTLSLERQLETFRAAATAALRALIAGQPAPEGFTREYSLLLDEERQDDARDELSKRREAWRQEAAALALETPKPGEEASAQRVLATYQQILDQYDQIDGIKWEMAWVADVVRYFQARYEEAQRGPGWYATRVGLTVALLAAVLALSVLLGRWTMAPIRRRPTLKPWLRTTLFATYVASVATSWLLTAGLILTYVWGAVSGFERVGQVARAPLLTIGETEVTLMALASLVGAVVLTLVVNRLVRRWLERRVFTYFTWDQGVQHAVASVVGYVILFAGVALGLEYVGIGIQALALFAGVVGIGIGFGLQNIASNFISGLIILFERPVKKGDYVDAGGLEGRVDEIRARATSIVTRDNVTVIVPNSEFVASRVVNWSHGDETARIHVPVGVAYGSDVALVTRVLLDVATKHPKVLATPAPTVRFVAFGASSLDFELLFWTADVPTKGDTRSDLNYAIDAAFREHGIEIPFPQQDVRVTLTKPLA
jgi:small-conductance mechanosensitive channel